METYFLGLLGALYETTADMSKWSVFLGRLAEIFHAAEAQILHFDQQDARLNFSFDLGGAIETHDLPAELVPALLAASSQAALAHPRTLPLRSENALSTVLADDDGNVTRLSVTRAPDAHPFTQTEQDLLDRLIPNLNGALKLHKHVHRLEFERRMSSLALDHLPIGIVVMNTDGEIHTMNRYARTILNKGDGLSINGKALVSRNPDDAVRISELVQDAVGCAETGTGQPGITTVQRTGHKKPYTVLISTHWNETPSPASMPVATMFITDPEHQHPQPPHELLQALFGLTRSEAGLTGLLANGASLEEAAGHQGITVNTARQYLKSVFQKTETNRQAELVRKIKESPIWICQTEPDQRPDCR